MKTYLLDVLNRYKRFSETLDVKTILCNKSWLIFNDSGEKEVYIFQEDGSLIISFAGKVTHATWQYLPVNKSLIIDSNEDAYMLHPAFVDENLFVLQQDGTDRFAFMIEEKQSASFSPRSLTELNAYFEEKERKKIQEQQLAQQKALEQERIEYQKRLEEERNSRQKAAEQARIKRLEDEAKKSWEKEKDSILENDTELAKIEKLYHRGIWIWSLLGGIGTLVLLIALIFVLIFEVGSFFLFLYILLFGIMALFFSKTSIATANPEDYIQRRKQQYINEYIAKHGDS